MRKLIVPILVMLCCIFISSCGLIDSVNNFSEAVKQFDPLRIESSKRNAVELALLKRAEATISVQVVECVGRFKISGVHVAQADTDKPWSVQEIWRVRVSDIADDISPRPTPPTNKDVEAFKQKTPMLGSEQVRNLLNAVYKKALSSWDRQYQKRLKDNGINLTPNFATKGFHGFRISITPEAETGHNWKIRYIARLESHDGKQRDFINLISEKRDFSTHVLGTPLTNDFLYFYTK